MMASLRVLFFLLAALFSGLAQASYAFDDAPRASDEVLDSMRGGFVVSWNGMEFMMPFSIDGIERLTQIGGQTFINGELISPRLNPQALIPISQTNQISVNVQTRAPDVASSGIGGASVGSGVGDPVSPGESMAGDATTGGAGAALAVAPQVTTNGPLIVIQHGVANTVSLPANVSLDSLATFIQNSVNDQVIRNITTLNITLEAQKIAAQARINSILNQGGLNGLR
jgi:hypothetical protein